MVQRSAAAGQEEQKSSKAVGSVQKRSEAFKRLWKTLLFFFRPLLFCKVAVCKVFSSLPKSLEVFIKRHPGDWCVVISFFVPLWKRIFLAKRPVCLRIASWSKFYSLFHSAEWKSPLLTWRFVLLLSQCSGSRCCGVGITVSGACSVYETVWLRWV